MDFETDREYRIFHSGYPFPSYGTFVEARQRADGETEYVFRVTRSVDVRIRHFALLSLDITDYARI